jgi:8-oxo-dGTP pyrophosphatase MutT (NUDIX family)
MAEKKEPRRGSRATRLQYGALPYRVTEVGDVEILLITSRGTGRWIIPKGWPMKGRKPSGTAAREAYEEAGLRGDIGGKAIGTYTYEKYLDEVGVSVPCAVRIFPLLVKRHSKAWPENGQRQIQWFPATEAARLVQESELSVLILAFEAKVNAKQQRRQDHARQV